MYITELSGKKYIKLKRSLSKESWINSNLYINSESNDKQN